MKWLNVLTLLMLIAGGLNWALVGLFGYDLVATLAGGEATPTARAIYVLIGAAAVVQVFPFLHALTSSEVHAETT